MGRRRPSARAAAKATRATPVAAPLEAAATAADTTAATVEAMAVTATGAAAEDAAAAGATAATAATVATGATEVGRRRSAGAALLAVLTASSALPAGPAVEVHVSRRGFEPSRIVLRRGETARLVLQSVDGEHCFAVDGLRVEKRVVSGRPTRLELTPERTGSFSFHCCLESGAQADRERGEIVVSE